jgi:transcriptional regulator with XRE-family HTH domain
MDKTSFPEKLAEERKRRGYTQKQIAQALGVSDRTYSKWETGENEMDVDSLCRLAELYGESPALFFRDGGAAAVRTELAALPPKEAAAQWFRVHYEAIRGMGDSIMEETKLDPSIYLKPVPWAGVPEDPSEQRGKSRSSITYLSIPDLMGIFAAGEDLNLSVLMEPNKEHYAWIHEEAEKLGALFRVLGMPGALPCLSFLLRQDSSDMFSVPYLAAKTGVSEEETRAFLEVAAPLGLCVSRGEIRRKGKEEKLYCGFCREALVGLLSLAKLLIPDEAARGRYGHTLGIRSRLTGLTEKGAEE